MIKVNNDFEKLVDLLDNCVQRGSAHIKVKVGEEDRITETNAVCDENGACAVPTLHKGIDD